MATLWEKVYGVEAATTIANSMGDVTEMYSWDEIEQKFGGLVTELLPQHDKWSELPVFGAVAGDESFIEIEQEWGYPWIYKRHDRPPGQSEDGHERHRLMVSAIIEKGGRVTIEELAKTWIRDIDPENFGYLLGPQDQAIYYSLKAGVPPWDVGRYASFPGMIGTSKMMIPVGVINAGNPDQAARDALDLGRLKDQRGRRDNYANEVAAAVAAGTAEAFSPAATPASILDTALAQLPAPARREVDQALAWAHDVSDWRELRPLFQERYAGRPMSNAVEVFSGAVANFVLADGHVEEAIIQGVNMGRDCDCRAYIAGGWSAALRGIDEVPERWIATVTDQVVDDPYTVSRRTPEQSARGLYDALVNELESSRRRIDSMTALV